MTTMEYCVGIVDQTAHLGSTREREKQHKVHIGRESGEREREREIGGGRVGGRARGMEGGGEGESGRNIVEIRDSNISLVHYMPITLLKYV